MEDYSMFVHFFVNGFEYRTNGKDYVEGHDGKTWNSTGSLAIILESRKAWARAQAGNASVYGVDGGKESEEMAEDSLQRERARYLEDFVPLGHKTDVDMKGEVRHTPGPWRADKYGASFAVFGIFDGNWNPGDDRIAYLYGEFAKRNPQENEANAYLIASAPDMLSALERASWEINAACDKDDAINTNGHIGDAIRIMQAAITKAKGR